jgi:FtsH-binding integral membrane protein
MKNQHRIIGSFGGVKSDPKVMDLLLRSYMLKIYNYMTLALALTGIVAMLVASSPAAISLIFGSPLKWLVLFAPIGLVFFISARLDAMAPETAQALFWLYAGLMGVSLSAIFVVYTGASIAKAFFVTAGTFGGMSLYGYTTRKSLASWGSFLFMAVMGIFIASIVNLFMKSSQFSWIISAVSVLVFTALTAYETQTIREHFKWIREDDVAIEKTAIISALSLYMNFVNIFVSLLRLFGERR